MKPRLERIVRRFESPELAEAATREDYQRLTPNERVALTLDLQRRYFETHGAPRRLSRVLTVLKRE
jgi:hypothetical protein